MTVLTKDSTPIQVRAEWVRALREDDILQGQDYLGYKDDDGAERRCCLGVLCDMAVAAGLIGREVTHEGTYTYGGENETNLPNVVRKWAGLKDESGEHRTAEGWTTSLADLNDTGRTFVQIAQVIEDEVSGLIEGGEQ